MVNIDLLIIAIVFILLDGAFLNFNKAYFSKQIKLVQGKPPEINLIGVLLCYTFLIFGFNYFIIQKQQSVLDAFFLGLVINAVYEFTNYAFFYKLVYPDSCDGHIMGRRVVCNYGIYRI